MNLEEAYGLLNNIYVNFSKSAKGYYVYSYRPQLQLSQLIDLYIKSS